MLGLVITHDGKMYKKDFGEPLYQAVKETLGGYMEHVIPTWLPEPYCLLINDEGKLRGLPVNEVGSIWYGSHLHGDPIVGNIIVMMDGYKDGERDIVGMTPEQCNAIINEVYEVTDEEWKLVDEPGKEQSHEEQN